MSPTQGTRGTRGAKGGARGARAARGNRGVSTPQQNAVAALGSEDDAEMREVDSNLEQNTGNANSGEEVEMTEEDHQAVSEGYQADLAAEEVGNALTEANENDDTQPQVQPGLEGFGASMSSALANVSATPSASSPIDAFDFLVQTRDRKAAERKALEAAQNMVVDTPMPTATPTATPTRKRNASASSFGPVPKKTKAIEFPFHDLMRENRPLKFAIAINEGGPIIGFPFDATSGMKMTVKLDPGSLGIPSIGLSFSLSKDGVPPKDKNDHDHYNHFTVGYEPGVKINGEWMIEELYWEKATNPSHPTLLDYTFPQEIQKLCKNEQQRENLYFLSYKVNAHRATHYSDEWLYPFAGKIDRQKLEDVDTTLNEMMKGEGSSYDVRLWVYNHRALNLKSDDAKADNFERGCLAPLQLAGANHLLSHHQYRNDNGDPLIDLDMATIEQVGNGMYLRRHDENSAVKNTGRGRMLYHSLPLRMTWEQMSDFHIYNGVSVVREHQFNLGLYAMMETHLHCVFLERLPIFEIGGVKIKGEDVKNWGKTFWAGVRMTRNRDGQVNKAGALAH